MDEEKEERRDEEEDRIRVITTEEIRDADDTLTIADVRGPEDLLVPIIEDETARRELLGPHGGSRGWLPDEDEEVNPVGSYESWNQSGQGLDAAGAGMTGDSGSIGLTGTGFEDDLEIPGDPETAQPDREREERGAKRPAR
ncbi:MAG TPA: hypothetical protein GX715_13910 [Armatimonadetes bacterium]|jgi:hypothetical protein|nr:hypothetical protein [Armatimonadota bacterium]